MIRTQIHLIGCPMLNHLSQLRKNFDFLVSVDFLKKKTIFLWFWTFSRNATILFHGANLENAFYTCRLSKVSRLPIRAVTLRSTFSWWERLDEPSADIPNSYTLKQLLYLLIHQVHRHWTLILFYYHWVSDGMTLWRLLIAKLKSEPVLELFNPRAANFLGT